MQMFYGSYRCLRLTVHEHTMHVLAQMSLCTNQIRIPVTIRE
jgi:hypothetical protein